MMMRIMQWIRQVYTRYTATPYYVENDMTRIEKTATGRFAIIGKGDQIIADYARRGDAVRGAARRGLAV
jgi:hypothetical protein